MIHLFGTQLEWSEEPVFTLAEQALKLERARMPLAIRVHNEVFDLRYIPQDGDEIEGLYLNSEDGFRAYRQTVMYIFMTAAHEIYPELKICLRRSINKSTYCEVENGIFPEEDFADKIKARMQQIIDSDLPIVKTTLTPEEAEAAYRNIGEDENAAIVSTYEKQQINLYSIGGRKIYMRGQLACRTGVIQKFDLVNFEHGLMLTYPNFMTNGELPLPRESRRLIRVIDEFRLWGDILGIHTVADLNRAIADGKTNDLIHMQEGFHEKKFAQIAEEIKVAFPRKRLVLIAGPSSSGKTTFAQRLKIHLRINGLSPVTISLDNYYKPKNEVPLDESGKPDLETVEAIDYKLFSHHLKELIEGKEVALPRFDFMLGKRVPGNILKLREEQIIIVEGIHALNEKLSFSIRACDKYKIYITPLIDLQFDDANPVSPTDLRLIRRIVRDMQFRDMDAEGTLKMWDSVQRGERNYIFPFEEQADTVFDSSFIYGFCVLKAFAWGELEKIGRDSLKYSEAQRLLDVLAHFSTMDYRNVPSYSLMREFIGGSSF